MEIKEIKAKSCMTKSKITDYAINPYVGCLHGCKYCYADFIKKFQNIRENWGDFCYVKINCPELLKKELEKNKPGHIWLSSVTDPYNFIESKYKLTRKILEIIFNSHYKNKFTIEILTKSCLVERDFDLINKLNAELGMSVNNLDNDVSKILEPKASSPISRINTLKKAKQKGIKVFGFIFPVLPGITDLERLFKELQFCNYVWVELLNTRKSVLNKLVPMIKNYFPDKLKNFEFAIKDKNKYCKNIKEQVKSLEKKYKLKVRGIVVH